MFSDLADYVASGGQQAPAGSAPSGAGSPPKAAGKETTASLLAKALARRGVAAPTAAASSEAPGQASPSGPSLAPSSVDQGRGADSGEEKRARESPTHDVDNGADGEALAASARRTVPPKNEYDVQQRARLVELDDAIKAAITAAQGAMESVISGDFSDAHAAGNAHRRYVSMWLRLLRALWERDVAAMPHEVRYATAGTRAAADHGRYANQMRTVLDGLEQDIVAFEAATAQGAAPPAEYNVPGDVARTLSEIFVAVAAGKLLAAEEHYLRLTMGGSAWNIGLFSGGNIHMRRNLDNIQKSAVRHVMNNAVAKDFLMSLKRLLGVAERHRDSALQLPWMK